MTALTKTFDPAEGPILNVKIRPHGEQPMHQDHTFTLDL